jgi:hypothetical protein
MVRWLVVTGLVLGLLAQPVPARAQVACGSAVAAGQLAGAGGYAASGAGADCGVTTTSGNASLLAVLQALASLYGPTPQFDPYANALAVSGLSPGLSRGTAMAATYAGSPTSWSGSPTASAPTAVTGALAVATGSGSSGQTASGTLPANSAVGASGSAPGGLPIPPTGLSFQGSPLTWSGSPLTGTLGGTSASASSPPAPARPTTLATGSAGPNAVSAAVTASANLYNYPGSPIVYAPGTSPTTGGSPPVGSATSAADLAPSGAPPVGAATGAPGASAPGTAASGGAGGSSPYGLLVWPGSTPSTAATASPSSAAPGGTPAVGGGNAAAPAASTLLPVVASPMGYLPLTFQVAQALFYGAAPTSNPQVPATMLVWGAGGASPAGSTSAVSR